MGKRDKNYCSIEQILDASSMSLPLRAEMLARSEDRHEHVGPSGPNSFYHRGPDLTVGAITCRRFAPLKPKAIERCLKATGLCFTEKPRIAILQVPNFGRFSYLPL